DGARFGRLLRTKRECETPGVQFVQCARSHGECRHPREQPRRFPGPRVRCRERHRTRRPPGATETDSPRLGGSCVPTLALRKQRGNEFLGGTGNRENGKTTCAIHLSFVHSWLIKTPWCRLNRYRRARGRAQRSAHEIGSDGTARLATAIVVMGCFF